MADLAQRYPLSTADGQAIPLEVVRPIGVVKKSFVTGSGTAAITIPEECNLIEVFATQNCILQFAASAASASALSDGVQKTSAFYLQANALKTRFVSPPIGMNSVSIIGDTSDGSIVLQYLKSWTGLSTAAQPTRR